jgi:hypothetical protein
VLDAEKIIIKLILLKIGSSALFVTNGYMKIAQSLMICAPRVGNRRRKKINEVNIKAREREKGSQALAIYPVQLRPTHPDMPGEMASCTFLNIFFFICF